jgi:hypothetical protein
MSDSGAGTLTCPACGNRLPWQDRFAGRKLRCKCGHQFVARRDPQPGTRRDDSGGDDEYGLAPDDAPPPPPTVRPAPGPQGVLAYQRNESAIERSPAQVAAGGGAPPVTFRDVWLPVALLVIGAVLSVVRIFLPGSTMGVGLAITWVLVGIVLNVVLTLLAVAIASKILGVSFGPVQQVVLKLTSMAVLAGAVAGVLIGLDRAPESMQGPIVALHAVVILYWVMIAMFFELDLQEALFTVALITAFQVGAFCIVLNKINA